MKVNNSIGVGGGGNLPTPELAVNTTGQKFDYADDN